MKIFLIILIFLSLFTLYFDGFIFRFGDNSYMYYYVFILFLLFATYILCYYKQFIRKIKFLYLKTPFRYLVYFIVWLFIDSLILIITGKAKLLIFYYIIVKLFIPAISCYFVSAIFIPKYISIKTLLKLLLSFMLCFILFGFVGYIGDNYNISICSNIVNSVSNLKYLLDKREIMTDVVSGGARMRSIFHEPNVMAQYLIFLSPILFKTCLSKYKIFQNKTANTLFKYTLIPLSILSIILTKSPIMLLFMIGFLLYYFHKNIWFFIKKHIVLIGLIMLFITVLLFVLWDKLEETYINRIIITLSYFNHFDKLVQLEQSLACRLVSFINSFILFLHSPILGYGYDNARFYMTEQFLHSPVPLTTENIIAVETSYITNQGSFYNKSLLTGLLAETGLIGSFLYYLFLYKNIKFIEKITPFFKGIERKFLEGLKIFILLIIVSSIYLSTIRIAYCYMYFGIVCSFITQCYIARRYRTNNDDVN